MSYAALADRYARAIFELGIESGQLKPMSDQIRQLAEIYSESPELRSVLDNPLVEEEKRAAILNELTSRLGMGELARNSVRLLAQRRRLRALPDIAKRLGTLSDEKAGLLRVSVTSAVPLNETQYQMLSAELERALSKRVILERIEDPSLLGGIVTRIGDNTIDGSLKGHLAELERQLCAG